MGARYLHAVLAVLLLLAAILGILLLVLPDKAVEVPPEPMYGIVLDAGSSHTAMYVYKWPAEKQNGTGIVTQHSQCHMKGGGISSYAGVPGGAAKSLGLCLDQAVRDIPKSRHHQTPLSLGATAGMRLLTDVNVTESQQVMREVNEKLRSYPFRFEEAAILSGQAEGAYGWVTVNYLLENFIKYGFVGRWLNPDRDTVGALDLGGASTQITFQTSEPILNQDNGMELKLYGQIYKLYTQSFLCYGKDQVMRKLLAHLIKNQGVPLRLHHPCYPKRFNQSIKLGKDVFDSPCTKTLRPARFDPGTTVTVEGTGDYQSCLNNVTTLFSFDNCSFSKCSFNGVFQPSVSGRFLAFSAYYYTHNYISSLSNSSITSFSGMEAATRQVCKMNISEMMEKTKQPETHMMNICAMANYVQVLLKRGYRFDDFSAITFKKNVEKTSVGWALGYMLIKSNLVPAEGLRHMKAGPVGNWTCLLCLFIVLLVLALVSLVRTIQQIRTLPSGPV
ncbi:ectonucleoside triphosphate diphosphohydrolase 2-like [Embiotoca jacksoni]|uniref:ectonucleoside triphosphate diphosphohydrolase 2-like n=1 Tax=Embiotoca jacksoni TaxID=100190 RepID=UPI003703B74E